MKRTPWVVLLCLGLAACSGSKSAQKVSEETPQIELSDADEFIGNPADEAAVEAADSEAAAATESAVTEAAASEEPVVTEAVVVEEANTEVQPSADTAPVVSSEAGATKEYKVQKNETLMLIAFKLYGDYEKWKELANNNQDVLKGSPNIKEGMVLKYVAPAEEFVWNPQGLPYLIRTGDTLGGISKNVYSDVKKWKLIWNNNKPLIKDPNKIYSGFTIYYLENGREVATEL